MGRVALINEGLNKNKLCVILDVIDQRRVGLCSLAQARLSPLPAAPMHMPGTRRWSGHEQTSYIVFQALPDGLCGEDLSFGAAEAGQEGV